VTVDPPAVVETCVMVVALGVVADVDGACDEDEVNCEVEEVGVEEVLDDFGVLLIEEEDVELTGRLVEDEVKAEDSEVETGVGLLLAIELDDIGGELAGDAGAEVEDAAREDGVLVELEPDIVNCLPKMSFLGCL
jgi:hypothetical protein